MPSFTLPLILGVFAFSLYSACIRFSLLNPLPSFDSTSQLQSTMTQANLQGWHARALAHPYPDPHSFVPRRENLKVALLRNSPLEHEGLSLAIFAEDNDSDYVVVDAVGRVSRLSLSSPDVNGLLDLGRQTLGLPIASSWRNIWMIKRQRSSQPIDRFFYISDTEKRETSVSGYSPTETELARPVGKYHHLPDVLQKLFGLVLEAREGYKPDRNGGNADLEVIAKVTEVLSDL